MLRKRSQIQECTYMVLRFYEITEQEALICSDKERSVAAQKQGWWELTTRDTRELSGVLETFYLLIVVVIKQVYIFFKTQQTVYLNGYILLYDNYTSELIYKAKKTKK